MKFGKTIKIFLELSILVIIAGFIMNAYVYHEGSAYILSSRDNAPHVEAAIILGAAVTQAGLPSPVLQDRILMAVDLYKQGSVSKILVSGSNPTVEYNEVNPVRKVLVDKGIPPEDIFLDHAGFDTFSSMYRAKEVFKVDSAIIVTQSFHLPRALYLARNVGLVAYGIPADRSTYTVKNYIRELFSRPKAFIDIVVKRMPKYVGPSIPISGNGTST